MVKKNLIHSFTVLLLLVVFLTSCSKKEEYTNVIPADAGMVVSLDMESMIEKSGLTDKDNAALLQKFFDSMKSGMSSSIIQEAEKIMKNPEESGLSIKDKIFFFNSSKNLALVVKVADEPKLKSALKLLENQNICTSVESGDGFSWVSMEGNILCAFNENTLLVMTSVASSGIEQLKADAKVLMQQKEENSLNSNAGFKKVADKKEDITLYVSLAGIPNMEMVQSTVNLPAGASLKDIMILGSLNFEKGKIVAKAEMFTENAEVKKMFEEKASVMGKPGGDFLEFFPASTLLFLNYSINGEKLYDAMMANAQYAEMMKGMAEGIDLKKLLSSFDGDISIGLTGLSGFGMPTILGYAKVKDDYLMTVLASQKQMLEMGLGAKMSATGKNAYEINYQGMNIYIGIVGNYLYATNDSGALARLGEKVADPMTKAPWASEAKKSPGFLAINFAEIMKNPLLGAFASSSDPNVSMAISVFSGCSYMQVFETSKGVGEIDIVLKNQDENVLKQLVNGMGAMAGN